jgi:hypothetical protein
LKTGRRWIPGRFLKGEMLWFEEAGCHAESSDGRGIDGETIRAGPAPNDPQ